MVKSVGRNTNVTDTATLPAAITLNATTSVLIASANPDRIAFIFSNPANQDVWLKFQPTTTDDDKKGIIIMKGTVWDMSPDNIYTGEICAIAASDGPAVTYTEY